MKQVHQFLVGGFDKNCTYICTAPNSQHAVVIDPAGDLSNLHHFLDASSFILQAIWLTHTHEDHMDGVAEIHTTYGTLPIYVHTAGKINVAKYGVVHLLNDQDTVWVGDEPWTVWHTPGHSPDSICFWHHNDHNETSELISGDTLFVRGCGRTTPQEAPTLFASLQQLCALPDHTTIYPGHDYGPNPTSTIGDEKEHNPFLQTTDLNSFMRIRFPND